MPEKVLIVAEVVRNHDGLASDVRLDDGLGEHVITVHDSKLVKFDRLKCEHPCAACKKHGHKRQPRRKA